MTFPSWPQKQSSSAPGLSPERVNQTAQIKAEQSSSFQVKVSSHKIFPLFFKLCMQITMQKSTSQLFSMLKMQLLGSWKSIGNLKKKKKYLIFPSQDKE